MRNKIFKINITLTIALCLVLFLSLSTGFLMGGLVAKKNISYANSILNNNEPNQEKTDFIKWVDFNASNKIMQQILKLSKKHFNSETKFDFIEALAYLATKNGNKFSEKTDSKNLSELAKKFEAGSKISDFYGENKYYKYYLEAYNAIFSGIVGESINKTSGEAEFDLKGYFPIADGFWYNHYEDFGNSRSFGFKRKHLGHDIMGGIGTPIIAVEGGTISELGWNRYGGWRIGIRSQDQKRYYYYAHLRKNTPFVKSLNKGDIVEAGQVIGYLGQTGYSDKENVNLKTGKPHLHFGLQLIFDESQVKGNGEIWIDVYPLCNFLQSNMTKVKKDIETKEYYSVNL